MYYDFPAKIDSRDVDINGFCRPSALLGHLQEAATLAAEYGRFGRSLMLEQHRAFWMIVRVWVKMERPLYWQDPLTIRTWHRGGQGVQCYRDFDLLLGSERVGEAVSIWVLTDIENRQMLRVRSIPALEGTDGGELCKKKTLSKLRMPQEMKEKEQRLLRYSDTDLNGHVNNTRYADFACDALALENSPRGHFLTEAQINFTGESRLGERLSILVGSGPAGQYVCGVDGQGKSHFESVWRFGEAAPDRRSALAG